MKIIISKFLLLSLLVTVPYGEAASCVQNNNTVTFTGLDQSDGTLFAAVSGHDGGCGCDAIRFRPANIDTQKALAILLTAKTTNQKVRIDLAQGDCDTGFRVYLQ